MQNKYKNLSELPPMPTKSTIFLRNFIPWQIYRFIIINIKMIKLIYREHK